MKVIIDIQENRANFFMELLKSLDYVDIVKEISDSEKEKNVVELIKALDEVDQYESGHVKLKKAKDLQNEI